MWILIAAVVGLGLYELNAELERKLARVQAQKRNKAAVLAALRVGPGRAFELSQRVTAQTEGKLVLGATDFFAAIEDLEREGVVERFEVERHGRSLRYYKLRHVWAEGTSSPRGKEGAT